MGVKDGRFAYYCTEDNLTPEALRDRLFAAGWSDAIMMDGGGSATLAWWDAEKRETVIPNRHGLRFLGYRPVAMNLGFYYE